MTDVNEVYLCEICGNKVKVIEAGAGQLVCCGQPMGLLAENTTDAATEKHVPVIENVAHGFKVTVGSVAHPMEENHYIEWIEMVVSGKSYRQFLDPGDAAEAFFPIPGKGVTARAYCNLHGLWMSQS